jgi:hypothetical protein
MILSPVAAPEVQARFCNIYFFLDAADLMPALILMALT